MPKQVLENGGANCLKNGQFASLCAFSIQFKILDQIQGYRFSYFHLHHLENLLP